MKVNANGQLSPGIRNHVHLPGTFIFKSMQNCLMFYMSHFPLFQSYARHTVYMLYIDGITDTFTLNSHSSGSSVSSES